MWADKKEYEAALRQINLRLESLAAKAAEGGGNMVYTTAVSHQHGGGGGYETVLNIAATHSGQAQVFFCGGYVAGTLTKSYLKITVNGVVVLTDLENSMKAEAFWSYGGIWNFSTSLKIEHKSTSNLAYCKVAYCSV
jgi:hypothetical protein